jgi:hypothetical protein
MKKMSAVSMLLFLGVGMLGCNAAKQTNPQSNPQYVPVPAITGQWTIAFNGGPTVQVDLVSIPCGSISAIAGDGGGAVTNNDGATASSCSIANLGAPDTGGMAVGSITASATDGYSPETLLIAAEQDSNGTVMSIWFSECLANSVGDCYGPLLPPNGSEMFFGNSATVTATPSNFTGTWNCNSQGSNAPCSDQTGTYIATQE